MLIPVDQAGQRGVIVDRRPHELPINAWSAARNVRFRDGFAEKFLGHSQQFGTPTVAPYFLQPVATATSLFWVYLSLLKAYVWDGSAHTNITRTVGGDYAATADLNWTVGVLGGVPVFNNGVDDPQMWLPVSTGTPLAVLSNWPANTKCRALRAFKQFLVAMDVTKASVRYPHMIKWSHPAAPGAVPSSWDETDATKDAGEWELKDTGDFVLDSATLRDINVIYKENTTHGMQFIGGTAIFRFFKIFDTLGALSRRCALECVVGRHAVLGDGDIVLHDGQTAQSLVASRLRRRIYNSIDSTYYQRSFVAYNAPLKEVWFCFPETGNTLPNIALVWNMESDTFGFRDLPSAAHIAAGVVDPGSTSDQWATDTGTWDSDSTVWDQRLYNPSSRRMLMAVPGATKIYMLDDTNQAAGVDMTVELERTGLPIPLRTGHPPDMSIKKQIRRIWLRVDGTAGGQLSVYVGGHDTPDDAPIYSAAKTFVIGTDSYVEARVVNTLLALKIVSMSNVNWRLHGYEIEAVARGSI